MRITSRVAALVVVLIAAFAGTVTASASHIHFVGTPTCTVVNGGTAVECSGKIAGLGQAPTTVTVEVQTTCTNQGGNQPGGLASGTSAPIQPSGGQITFDVTTSSANSCPDHMTLSFGSTATIIVKQGGQTAFTATIPIT